MIPARRIALFMSPWLWLRLLHNMQPCILKKGKWDSCEQVRWVRKVYTAHTWLTIFGARYTPALGSQLFSSHFPPQYTQNKHQLYNTTEWWYIPLFWIDRPTDRLKVLHIRFWLLGNIWVTLSLTLLFPECMAFKKRKRKKLCSKHSWTKRREWSQYTQLWGTCT